MQHILSLNRFQEMLPLGNYNPRYYVVGVKDEALV